MANNEEQNTNENIKEAVKGAEEAAKLAANAASGNLVGAAKNAVNLVKNKKTRRAMLMSVLQPILIILLIAAAVFGIWNGIKDTLIGFASAVGTAVSDAWRWLTDDYWIDLNEIVETDDEGYEYTLVDKYIKDLDATGISLDSLGILGEGDYSGSKDFMENDDTRAKTEKYIAEFIRADLITQQPHKRSGKELVNPNDQNKIDGSVYLYRTKAEPVVNESEFVNGQYIPQEEDVSSTDYKQMTYVSYEEFTEMVNNDDPDIRYHFSIDPDTEELALAEIKKTTVIEDNISNPIGQWFASINDWLSKYDLAGNTTYEVTEIKIPYKEYIAKYTMPYEFLLNLCQVTKNPEFVYHVALLARESYIVLGVQDDTTVDRVTEEIEEDYRYYRKEGNDNSSSGAATDHTSQSKKRIVTTTTTQTPRLRIEYADTWSFYEEFEYSKMLTGEITETGPIEEAQPIPATLSNYHEAKENVYDPTHPGLIVEQGHGEYWDDWFLEKTRTNTQSIHTTKTYSEPILKDSVEKSKQFLGLLINTEGTCSQDCYEESAWRRENPEALTCVQHSEFDRNGKKVAYRIPNNTKKEAPLDNLLSGLDILYALMQSNSTGYEEVDLTDDNIKQSIGQQDDLISSGNEKEEQGNDLAAFKDYESAYVVKMQGLVEHMRHLMTFPEEETYTIKDLILDILPGDEDEDEYEYDEGFNYGFWWPVNASYSPISSSFGWRIHPVDKIQKFHNGIDIDVPIGTDVIATADGTVSYVGTNPNEAAGLWIKIDHGNGISSVYMHLSQIKVQNGQVVSQGQVIGLSGNTGKTSGDKSENPAAGAHLHFGISVNGTYVDPLLYVSPTNRTPAKPQISADTSEWRTTIQSAFSKLGYTMTEEKVSRILRQISTESKGNQNIIQGIKDVNSGKKIGINNGICPWCPSPSGKSCNNTNIGHGLLQFIPTTFESCKIAGHGDIFSGYDQICALIVNCETKAGGSYRHIGNGTGWSPK